MAAAHKLPPHEFVARLVAEGVSPKKIAERYDCTPNAVYALLRFHGTSVQELAPPPPKPEPQAPFRVAHRKNLPFVPPPPWTVEAKCADRDEVTDPDVFHPAPKDRTTLTLAKRICQTCPVRPACLEHALEHHEPDGVWGGKSSNQRRRILRARREAAVA